MSARVDFYVIGRAAIADKYACACRIANKAHAQGLKVYMQTDDPSQSQRLDKLLWTFSQSSFVPHAVCDAGNTNNHNADRYPVQIGSGDAPAQCLDVLISLKREAPADYARFGRVAEFIINDAGDKAAGRKRFRFYRAQGIEPQMHEVA